MLDLRIFLDNYEQKVTDEYDEFEDAMEILSNNKFASAMVDALAQEIEEDGDQRYEDGYGDGYDARDEEDAEDEDEDEDGD